MKINYLYFILVLISTACANIKPPTGGEKDLLAPIMIKSIPPHNSTNFQGDEITLFFNEQIETKSLMNELIITPDDNIAFKEIPKKKSVTIRLKDTLRQNTTYNLNFGNSIVDITEKNPSSNAVIAFSTGKDIDTAFIKGKVLDMYTQQPLKDVIAVLQPLIDTIDIQKHKPAYLSRVDEEGFFSLNNLPKTDFRLYAIKDDNGNLIYNVGKEKIALYPEYVMPSYKDTVYQLFLSPQDTRQFSLLSQRHHYNYSTFSFNKGIYDYSLDSDTFFTFTSNKSRSLNIFHPFDILDSLPVFLHSIDSNSNVLDSTIYISKNYESDTLVPEFSINIIPENGDVIKMPDTIYFYFNLRIASFNIDSTLIVSNRKDSSVTTLMQYQVLDQNSLLLENPNNKAKEITIKIKNSPIVSIYNDTIRNIQINYKIPNEEKYGQIDGQIKSPYTNLILQIITPKGVTKKELYMKPGPFSFKYIEPGTYKLRLIHDENKDGIWTPGDHYKNQQPEKVVIYEEEILIKANWIVQDKMLTID